jgi:hypothetical protein
MSVIANNIVAGAAGQGGAEAGPYQIDRSLRFNSADSSYLSFQPSSAGNRRTWTWSGWVKRSGLTDTYPTIFGAGTGGNSEASIRFNSNSTIEFYAWTGGYNARLLTTQVFRDTSAWYHLVAVFDTTNATASNRIRLYINGSEITTFSSSTNPGLNYEGYVNNSISHTIGDAAPGASPRFFNGYLADVHFIDGQALAPTDFGEYDDNNVWQPKAYSGTYGTNGFHLDFSDNSSNAALGDDSSGNNNDWTVNNLVVAAPGNTISPSSVSLTPPTSGFLSGRDSKFYVMDGDTSSYLLATSGGYNYSVNFSPGITVNTSVEIYGLTAGQQVSTNLSSSTSYKVDGVLLIGDNDESVIDSLVDSPTNGDQEDTGAGGEVVGNYCTWNPNASSSSMILSNGNLESKHAGGWVAALGSIGVNSGKWYWEMTLQDGTNHMYGVAYDQPNLAAHNTTIYGYYNISSQTFALGAQGVSYGSSSTTGDIIGVALDLSAGGTNGTLTFYKNNTSMGTAFSNIDCSKTYFPWVLENGNSVGSVANFGQRGFAYAAPSGFKALCTANLPDPTIADGSTAMDALLFTGNGGSQTLSGLGFSPDFTWFKARSFGFSHELLDIVRGGTKILFSDLTNGESTNGSLVTSFNSDGVSIGSALGANGSSRSSVLWAWDGGTSTVSNTDGSITSTVRANPSAGFSVVGYNGGNGTVGHGLGVAPNLIIVKNRNSSTDPWVVYHASLGNTQIIYLNYTNAAGTFPMWNNTSPTSTVFSVGSNGNVNGNCIAYCFAPVDGYSSFGSYVGNGSSDGPMVFTNFRPRWVMIKVSSSTENWYIIDTARDAYNVAGTQLKANRADAEDSFSLLDLLSNGFKIKNANASYNSSGATYIYAAFAEHPFKTARAR